MPLSAVHLERFGVRHCVSHTISSRTNSCAELIGEVFLIMCWWINGVPGRLSFSLMIWAII